MRVIRRRHLLRPAADAMSRLLPMPARAPEAPERQRPAGAPAQFNDAILPTSAIADPTPRSASSWTC